MSIKSDQWIKRMCREQRLIEPFEEKLVRRVGDRKIISCGLSSYGYDCRLARDEFKVFSPVTGTEIDPKNFDTNSLLAVPIRRAEDGSEYWLLPPHSYALGVTVEKHRHGGEQYTVVHNSTVYFIGPAAELIAVASGPHDPTTIAADYLKIRQKYRSTHRTPAS